MKEEKKKTLSKAKAVIDLFQHSFNKYSDKKKLITAREHRFSYVIQIQSLT